MSNSDMTVHAFIESVRTGRNAWPGGYPKFWLTSDGATLNYDTVRDHVWQIARAIRDNDSGGWRVVACDINWEDPHMYCEHSGDRIPSAYAENDDTSSATERE